MLLALSLLATPPGPIAVEVTGMAPQIALVEQAARKEGWTRVCTGRAGEETVLRFTLPAGASDEGVLEALGGRAHFISGFSFFHPGDPLPATCDREPVRVGGKPSTEAVARTLAVGTVAALTPQLEIARSCGFGGAHIRDPRDGDARVPADRIKAGYKTLDAGEDVGLRYGPSICYVQMRERKP